MTPNSPLQLDASVRRLLETLRGRIRRYVWLEGLATAVAWVGLAFWGTLAVDWFFEAAASVRELVLAGVAIVLAAIVLRLIVLRLAVRLSDRSMALLLERRFPQFNETLLTAVELSGRDPHQSEFSTEMLARTCRLATEPVGGVQVRQVFNPRPLRRATASALCLAAAVAAFAVWWPSGMGIWARRSLLLADEIWPRHTRLSIDGFPKGVAKVAPGDNLTVTARADLGYPVVPETVYVRYRSEGGPRLQAAMSREGTADRRRDHFQEYSHTFSGVLSPIHFDLFGGDDAVRGLWIEVVDYPAIVAMTLECRYPAYMGRRPRSLPVAGSMTVPRGTVVTVRAWCNKDLVDVRAESGTDESRGPATTLAPGPQSPRSFSYALAKVTGDRLLQFTLHDRDGIRSHEPVRLSIAAVADQSPQLTLQLRGIGSAVTPGALPVAGPVTDDYGLARIWFEPGIDQHAAKRVDVRTFTGNPTDYPLEQALELEPLGLKPGQKFSLVVKAADRCDLSGEPNLGASERWILDVVTPEQLRSMLESRELVLRQRFEATIADVTESRDALLRMEFSDSAKPAASAPPGAEPGEAAKPSEPLTPERIQALRSLRVQRAMQNSQKDSQEIVGVAGSVLEIRDELVNNRIDTAELKLRLETGIAGPLQRIAGELFPELDRRLDGLQSALADEPAAKARLQESTAQLNAILASMKQVLGRMIELEDFNEAVEQLRAIIQAQKKLRDQTRERHKQRLRDLLQ